MRSLCEIGIDKRSQKQRVEANIFQVDTETELIPMLLGGLET